MVANATVTNSSILHSRACDIEPFFFGSNNDQPTTFPYANATRIILQSGSEPSEAVIEIKLAGERHERAPTLTALTSSPAYSVLKHNAPVVCRLYDTVTENALPVMSGVITEVSQSLAKDRIVVVVRDLRHRLNKLQIIGSFWATGTLGSGSTDNISYRQAEPFVCNPNGQPNKVYVNHSIYGPVPVMCTPNLNLGMGQSPSAYGTYSYTQASYWTAKDILKALFLYFDSQFLSSLSMPDWWSRSPDGLTWKKNYAEIIDDPKEFYAGSRKEPEYRLDGGKLCSLMQRVLTNAGGYALYSNPTDLKTNNQELCIVRTKYKAKYDSQGNNTEGISLCRQVSGAANFGNRSITDGEINENSDEWYSDVVVAGAPVLVERRIDNSTEAWATNALEQRFSSTDVDDMVDYINSKLSSSVDLKRLLQEAYAYFPHVGTAYGLLSSFDFLDGTSEAALGTVADVPRPILPHLLETYLQSTTAAKMSDVNGFRRPVIVEYNSTGTTWLPAGFADGLQIEANGTFFLNGLRDQGKTLKVTRLTVNTVSITPYKLRLTVAIPCDRRLTQWESSNKNPKLTSDGDRFFSGIKETLVVDAADLYTKEIQRKSWPIPESVTDATERGSSAEVVLRDDSTSDTSSIKSHAQSRLADVSRLRRKGGLTLPYLSNYIQPGTAIRSIVNTGAAGPVGEYYLGAVVQRVIITNSDGSQSQSLEFSP